MRTLEVWYGVFSPQILALVSKDTDVLSDEAFAADHQTIHKVSHTLAVDARDLESSNSLLLYDPLRNSRLPGLGGHTAAVIQHDYGILPEHVSLSFRTGPLRASTIHPSRPHGEIPMNPSIPPDESPTRLGRG